MSTAINIFYGLILAVVGLIFWRPHTLTILAAMVVLGYVYGIFQPWLPGRDGLEKGIGLAVLTLLGLAVWSWGWGHLSPAGLFNWSLGLGLLAFFTGAEFQGMNPLMRGEQANWNIEGLVGLAALALYGAGKLFL